MNETIFAILAWSSVSLLACVVILLALILRELRFTPAIEPQDRL
jgi:hypothetical protein